MKAVFTLDYEVNSYNRFTTALKPWPNGLASLRKFWICVQLAFRLSSHLRRLASTCDDLSSSNLFLLNLAAADLLVSVLNMPLTIATILHGSWMFGEFLCTLTAFLNLLSFVTSVMSLAMVRVNRYHFVVKWKTYQRNFSKRICAVYITLVWLFPGVLCLPPLLGWADGTRKKSFICTLVQRSHVRGKQEKT